MAAENIFQQYIRPVRSVQDYASDMDKQEQNSLTLAAARIQNQNAQQEFGDNQAMRAAYIESGGDQNKLKQLLTQRGMFKQSQALDTTMLGNRKIESEIGKNTAQGKNFEQQSAASAYKLKIEKADQAIKDMVGFATPQDAAASLQRHVAAGDVPAEHAQSIMQAMPQDHAQFTAWQLNMLKNLLTAKDRIALVEPDANNINTNLTSRANNAATVANAARTANMVDSRSRDSNGKAPPGYIWGPVGEDGNPTLIAAKGGPADLKMAGALNQDTQTLTSSTSSMDRLATAANEAMKHPGLAGTAGLRGAIPNIPGSKAADAAALLNTLKSQVAFGVLQDMRNNSKTGGALGSVSDAEGKRLEANLAALEKSQSVEQLKASLQKIVDYTEGAKDRLRGAYNLKHGPGSVNPATSASPSDPASAKAPRVLKFDASGNMVQ